MPAVPYKKSTGKRKGNRNYLVEPHIFLMTAEQSCHKMKGEPMKRFNLILILLSLAFLNGACRGLFSQGQPDRLPILEPGSKINNMVLTTGVEGAIPLWSFCERTAENDNQVTVTCPELSYPRLAIGTAFNMKDLIPPSTDIASLTWQISLDEYPVNSSAFDIHDIVTPGLLPNPVPVREGFRIVSVWDIVLENPTPGRHRLQGMAKSENETYGWIVDFAVDEQP